MTALSSFNFSARERRLMMRFFFEGKAQTVPRNVGVLSKDWTALVAAASESNWMKALSSTCLVKMNTFSILPKLMKT